MKVLDLILRSGLLAASRRMKPPTSPMLQVFRHDPGDGGSRAVPLDGSARRYGGARLRRPAPAADGDDGDARAGIFARPRKRGGLARRRCAGAGGRPVGRSGGGAGATGRDQGSRSAASGADRLASRQPPSADADHGQGFAHQAGSRDRGDGEGVRRARHRDRGAVRSRRRRLCGCARSWPWPYRS
jgi:hypothetical protein